MGVGFSWPFDKCSSTEMDNDSLESITVKSITFGDEGIKTPLRSISFKISVSEPTILKSLGSGKMILEGSVSFKGRDLDKPEGLKSKAMEIQSPDFPPESPRKSQIPDSNNPQMEAAIRLQKVYKSFRSLLSRAGMLHEWKLLDFAELKRSSISFFDMDKHETAISRWSRARTRAAKVGKGLLKNDKARKLALQHWLEAIDPRHRYGHNLHFYYNQWLHSQCQEPFFYWKCPRSKLQHQCIKYLGPMERKPYEIVVEDGKLVYKQTGELLQTTGENSDSKWIFVLSTSKVLYVGMKKKGTFQHSSFLAGGATIAAGRLVVENGVLKAVWPHSGHYRPTEENSTLHLVSKGERCQSNNVKAVWPHSGHYRPTEENFNDFISFLKENDVNLTNVKMAPVGEEESFHRTSNHLRCNSSSEGSLEAEEIRVKDSTKNLVDSMEGETSAAPEDATASDKDSNPMARDEKIDENDHNVEAIAEESILQRISSKKGMKSYQLGKQLSCKWTTGAGPRIGCVRDFPSELQFRALEQVNLSPRSNGYTKSHFSPRYASSLNPKLSEPAAAMSEEMRTQSLPIRMKENLYDLLIENIMDPAHVPYAHYGLMRTRKTTGKKFLMHFKMWNSCTKNLYISVHSEVDREGGRPLEMRVKKLDINGFTGKQDLGSSIFFAPCIFYAFADADTDSEVDQGNGSATSSEIQRRDVSHWTKPDSDLYLLHVEERKIMEIGVTNWQKACFVPTKSDALVVGFRRWFNKYAVGKVDWKGKFSGALPPSPPREQLMDR
ncbi:TBP-associated factor 7 isoform 1 [Hibiscus syriacus]|uniref:TBP-associated factor 7 isoform 1 n=1 Tax=Hibiscus syriacus TaxID=106335 RepID=A0A6A2WXT3_HIBSY|nr:TBP-associated factor 7 isoform 1 [Hibiscus syriacus]